MSKPCSGCVAGQPGGETTDLHRRWLSSMSADRGFDSLSGLRTSVLRKNIARRSPAVALTAWSSTHVVNGTGAHAHLLGTGQHRRPVL
jgi:hypothetical protein